MRTIKCENCGKDLTDSKSSYIVLGKEVFCICKECKEICEKFKQDHDIK